jgi:hypothetical protein
MSHRELDLYTRANVDRWNRQREEARQAEVRRRAVDWNARFYLAGVYLFRLAVVIGAFCVIITLGHALYSDVAGSINDLIEHAMKVVR